MVAFRREKIKPASAVQIIPLTVGSSLRRRRLVRLTLKRTDLHPESMGGGSFDEDMVVIGVP